MRRLLVIFGFGVAFVVVIFLIYPRYGLAFSLVLMLILAVFLVRAYAMGYRYRCANCGHQFKVPLLVDFLTFSGMGRNPDGTYHNWKSLTCPSCGQRSRAIAMKVNFQASGGSRESDETPAHRRTVPTPVVKGRGPQRRDGRKKR
jgi:predicted RNA-binding Zn-ribbon protein involved in translation (DUF1610 family)